MTDDPNNDATPAARDAQAVPTASADAPSNAQKRLNELDEEISADETLYAMSKVEHVLRQGKRFSEARAICEGDNAGIEGRTPNSRFKKWRDAAKFAEFIPQRTAHNYRTLYECFGGLEIGVIERIGVSNCYRLASEEVDDWTRETVVNRAKDGERFSCESVQKAIRDINKGPELSPEEREAKAVAQLAAAGRKLSSGTAKLEAIEGMGISFLDIVGEMVQRLSPAKAARLIATALRKFDLWELVNDADPEQD